jgi:CubicO group peptidase (beta-lactamase class C family)
MTITKSRTLSIVVVISILLLVNLAAPIYLANAQELGPNDLAELEAFLDGLLAVQMRNNQVAGVTISVVKDGELFLTKGYGYADIDQGSPVDPYTTLFRIGSISKLFTWTAVMQLYEQGLLDLNADVNTYLDFEIPGTFSQPITMNHLLTHTPGFEDQGFGLLTDSPENLVPTGEWLRDHIPARVRPPGEFSAYSNYGTALAGYIVERVGGMSFDDYVEENILVQLGMEYATTRQPLPANLEGNMSQGYRFVENTFQPQFFELFHPAPAGSMSASAAAMAPFMIAHLQDGLYENNRILEAATAQQMHTQLFTHDQRLNGFAHGFYEMNQNGQWIIGHGGDTAFFHSILALLPDQGIGFFASYNSEDAAMLPQELLMAFIDRYYPVQDSAGLEMAESNQEAVGRFAGEYLMNRASYTTPEKILHLFTPVAVAANPEGTLTLTSPYGDQYFRQFGPLEFHEIDGDDMLLFQEDNNGDINYLYLNSAPMLASEKADWYQSPTFHQILFIVILILFFTVLITAPVGYFVNRVHGIEKPSMSARIARIVLFAVAILTFILVIGMMVAFSDIVPLMTGDLSLLGFLYIIPWVIAALTFAALVYTVLAWKDRFWHLSSRIHYTVVTLGAIALVWFFYYWNLLVFSV